MRISLTNSKLGDKIPSMNLPIEGTCREDVPCKKECYAKKGNYRFEKVQTAYKSNLMDFIKDSDKFFNDIIDYLNNDDIVYKYFRWFASGDIVNYNFFLGIVRVAKKTPQTRFLCYTKKYSIVNKYLLSNQLPSNLEVVFSGWDVFFPVDNPFNLPVTYVLFEDEERNVKPEKKDRHCCSDCKVCKQCWYLEKGEKLFFIKH